MKNKVFLIVYVLCVFVYAGCVTKNPQAQIGVETETIDFYAFAKTEGDIECLIKEKEYIKLDNSSDDFLFKRIDKIKITGDRIFILDERVRKLIVFDSAGRGIGKVGSMGQGPEEYLRIHDFDVDPSGNIYFMDATADNDRLFVFDKNLKFVSVRKLPFEANVIGCLQGNKLLFGLASWNKGENASLKIALTDTELKTERAYMQYDEYVDEAYGISGSVFVDVGNKILYNKSIDNFVYEFSDSGVPLKAYWFDFGGKNVPDKYKKDIEANLEEFKRLTCLKNFVAINDKYIMGTLWDNAKTKIFVIDRIAKKLYLGNEIVDGDHSVFSAYCNGRMISYIYPGKYENIRTTDLPDDIKDYIEDENFVICLSSLK